MKEDIAKYTFYPVKKKVTHTRYYTDIKCPDCGRSRKVQRDTIKSSKNFTGLCARCSLRSLTRNKDGMFVPYQRLYQSIIANSKYDYY